jgi:hypothetical protein
VWAYRRAKAVALVSGVVYLLIYLLAIGDVVISLVPLVDEAPFVQVVDEWTRMFRARVTFIYEPIAAVYVTSRLAYFFSPVNVLLAGALVALVGLNFAFLAFALKRPEACGRISRKGVLASIPALFLGFACCAPTILVALGSAAASVTMGFIAVRAALYPVALLGLLAALWLNLRRMRSAAEAPEDRDHTVRAAGA